MAGKKSIDSLPYNLTEEKIVLGIMIVDDILRAEALGSLSVDDFYEGFAPNRIVFQALRRIYDKNISLADDISFLSEELVLMNELETVGGHEYITHLIDQVTITTNFDEHIKILKNNTTLRNVLKLIRTTDMRYLSSGVDDIQTFVDDFSNQLSVINDKRRISNFLTTDELVSRYKEELPLRAGRGTNLAFGAISSGYSDVDKLTNGFKRGEYIVIAGRPSMGKTALALNFALASAKKTKRTVGFFSLEMPGQQLLQRMLSIDGRISSSNLTTGFLSDEEYARLESAYENVGNIKLYVDDSADNSVLDIVAKATKLKNSHPDLSMIIIDYLSFIKGDPKLKTEQEKVADISRRLKALAKTLEIPVIVLSQLSRNPDARTSKKPILSDLRSSGSIEQDADIVMLLYRAGYYLQEKEDLKNKAGNSQYKSGFDSINEQKLQFEQELAANGLSFTEVIIAKNRNGSTGVVRLLFNLRYGAFDLLTDDYLATAEKLYGGSEDLE